MSRSKIRREMGGIYVWMQYRSGIFSIAMITGKHATYRCRIRFRICYRVRSNIIIEEAKWILPQHIAGQINLLDLHVVQVLRKYPVEKSSHLSFRLTLIVSIAFTLVGCSNIYSPKDTAIANPIDAEVKITSILTSTPLIVELTPTFTLSKEGQNNPTEPSVTTPSKPVSTPIWTRKPDSELANQIRVLLFDQSPNILWSGGPDGIVRWDLESESHTQYAYGSKDNDSQVVALAQTPDRKIWIGTFGHGFSMFDGGDQWQTFLKSDGFQSDYISSLFVDKDGLIWIDPSDYARDLDPFEPRSLGYFDGHQWTSSVGGGFYKIVPSLDGTLWALRWEPIDESRVGILMFDGKKWVTPIITDTPIRTTSMTIAPNGEVWVATNSGVFVIDGNTWHKIYPPWINNPDASVSSIEVTQEGIAWFGFSHAAGQDGDCGFRGASNDELGVFRNDKGTWTHFTSDNGLVDNKICAITSGADGSVWFGSFDKGISQFDGKNWKSYVIP